MKIERAYHIHEKDLDFSGTLRPTSLLAILLETSGMAADQGGFGIKDVLPMGYTWVISRLSMEILADLPVDSMAKISTWIHDCEGIATTRFIQFCNEDGKEVARFASNWSLIDLHTRRPAHLSVLPQLNDCLDGDTLDIETVRIGSIAGGQKQTHRIGYSDIDFNRHANSIRYVEWMLNGYADDFWEGNRLRRIDINYLREGHWADEVAITRQAQEAYDVFDLSITGKSICKSRLTWEKR